MPKKSSKRDRNDEAAWRKIQQFAKLLEADPIDVVDEMIRVGAVQSSAFSGNEPFDFVGRHLETFIKNGHVKGLTEGELGQFGRMIDIVDAGNGDHNTAFFIGVLIGKVYGREPLKSDPKQLAKYLGQAAKKTPTYRSLGWDRIVAEKRNNPEMTAPQLMEFAERNNLNVTTNQASFERTLRKKLNQPTPPPG